MELKIPSLWMLLNRNSIKEYSTIVEIRIPLQKIKDKFKIKSEVMLEKIDGGFLVLKIRE